MVQMLIHQRGADVVLELHTESVGFFCNDRSLRIRWMCLQGKNKLCSADVASCSLRWQLRQHCRGSPCSWTSVPDFVGVPRETRRKSPKSEEGSRACRALLGVSLEAARFQVSTCLALQNQEPMQTSAMRCARRLCTVRRTWGLWIVSWRCWSEECYQLPVAAIVHVF